VGPAGAKTRRGVLLLSFAAVNVAAVVASIYVATLMRIGPA
jgi:hypothetical protein